MSVTTLHRDASPSDAVAAEPEHDVLLLEAARVDQPQPPFGIASDRQRPKSWPMRVWFGLCYGLEWLFGLASLLISLAVLAAIPVLNFLTLGYLLEASGHVARTGRLRDGFIDIHKFARIGSLVAGTWLCLLVPRLVTSLASDAWLIDPEGFSAQGWRIGQIAASTVVIAHVLLAWYAGGRLRHFLWPLLAPFQFLARLLFGRIIGPVLRPAVTALSARLADDLYVERPLSAWFPPAALVEGWRRGQMFADARDAVWNFLVELKLLHYFWLGARGFAGGLVWLVAPSLMLMAGTSGGGAPTIVLGYLGACALAWVLWYLPLLQTRFAAENRLWAMFELREARAEFRRAPLAYWLGLSTTLLFAIPLFLLKIEPVLPPELQWLITIFFIMFIYPARLLTGWAVSRARRRERARSFVWRWLARAAALPVIVFYILVLFLTQYTSFLGPASLLEQHAFLLPVPFFSL